MEMTGKESLMTFLKMNKLDIVNEELVVQEYVVGVEYVVDFSVMKVIM